MSVTSVWDGGGGEMIAYLLIFFGMNDFLNITVVEEIAFLRVSTFISYDSRNAQLCFFFWPCAHLKVFRVYFWLCPYGYSSSWCSGDPDPSLSAYKA